MPDQPQDGAQWLTTSEAADVLGVSPRTVRRRCEAGELAARFVAGVWEVDGQAVTDTRPGGHGQSDTLRPDGQAGDTGLNVAADSRTQIAVKRSRTDGQGDTATRSDGQQIAANDRREIEAELRAQLAREREFSAILKAQLEAVTQSEAQTKAALREALRAMPKQLGQGAPSEAPAATPDKTATDEPPARPRPATRAPRPFWKTVLGIR